MYEIVHQATNRFFGMDEMYKLMMDECTTLFEYEFFEIG